jgi:hypothetical protein
MSSDQPTRRELLKRAGVGGAAVVWSVPVVQSIAMPQARAAGSEEPGGGDPGGTDFGDMFGRITDADTGLPVFTATVTVLSTGQSGNTSAPGDDGQYFIGHVPSGPQTLTAVALHYIPSTRNVIVPVGLEGVADFVLSQVPHVEVVLTWGDEPADMDLHLSGPDGSNGRFHVWPKNRSPTDFALMVQVDDDIFGPEKISVTISTAAGEVFVEGSYHVWVHDFGHAHFGFANLADSEGAVVVHGKARVEGSFVVDTASGDPENDIWLVCTFDLDSDGNMSNLSQGGGYNQFVPGTELTEF